MIMLLKVAWEKFLLKLPSKASERDEAVPSNHHLSRHRKKGGGGRMPKEASKLIWIHKRFFFSFSFEVS